jgi:hypothetical protein
MGRRRIRGQLRDLGHREDLARLFLVGPLTTSRSIPIFEWHGSDINSRRRQGNPEAVVLKSDGDGGEEEARFVEWQTAKGEMYPRVDAPPEIATIAWVE